MLQWSVSMYDNSFENWIGYSHFLQRIEPVTSLGRKLLNRQTFFTSKKLLDLEHLRVKSVSSWDDVKTEQVKQLLSHCKDIRNTFIGSNTRVLSLVELYEVKVFCIIVEQLVDFVGNLPELELISVCSVLSILDPNNKREFDFCIDDTFSEFITDIRKRKSIAERELCSNYSEENISKRNSIVLEENEEEIRVCRILSKKISEFSDILIKNSEIIAELDLLICKSEILKKYAITLPMISDENYISFENMFHPEILEDTQNEGHRFVPLTIEFGYGTTVVTGANMGGKSVLLKTLGFNVILAMTGWPVFADKACLPMISNIKCIFPQEDCENKKLSTFGLEIKQINDIIGSISDSDILLIDEPARGTNPYEGAAIVKGITEYFNSKNIYTVITTHYDGVSQLAQNHYRIKGLKNDGTLSLEYGIFKCDKGKKIPREAINVCKILGLSDSLIDRIEANLKDGE